MYTGKLVFSRLMDHLPWDTFHRYVKRCNGNHKVKSFFCAEQYRCTAFARLACRESLRDMETCLRAQEPRLCHTGIRSSVSRSTLANANRVRDSKGTGGETWRRRADMRNTENTGSACLQAKTRNHDDLPGQEILMSCFCSSGKRLSP